MCTGPTLASNVSIDLVSTAKEPMPRQSHDFCTVGIDVKELASSPLDPKQTKQSKLDNHALSALVQLCS